MKTSDEKCFVCDRPLLGIIPRLADTSDGQRVHVGPECAAKILRAGILTASIANPALAAAYGAGRQASIDADGVPGLIPNPYPMESEQGQAWNLGWNLHWDPVWKFGEGADKEPAELARRRAIEAEKAKEAGGEA